MASAIKRLSDADLEAVRHLLRRDALSDLEIAREVEKRLKKKLGPTDAARAQAVYRYRRGKDFKKWLERWENQDAQLKRAIATQKQRFEYLKSLVEETPEGGLYAASKHLLARLLVIAAGASDEELKRGDVKWMKGLLAEIRQAEELERKALGNKAAETAADSKLSPEERAERVRQIFGIRNSG